MPREWFSDAAEGEDVAGWLRRVYEKPETGALVAMDSAARRFTGKLAESLRIRDRSCRTPYCNAPVRHLDHPTEYADGARPRLATPKGSARRATPPRRSAAGSPAPATGHPDRPHIIDTITPTGHTYASTAERVAPAPPRRVDFTFPITLAA